MSGQGRRDRPHDDLKLNETLEAVCRRIEGSAVGSSLLPVGEPPEGADHLELHIQTVTGTITLRPA